MKQIPREGTAFREMDQIWRRIMQKTQETPLMTAVAEFPGLLEELQQCNQQLDIVEKGLNDFLDTKKIAFPRFFFLSNDELLEILSEAKDPLNVQPFVKKCFEAVKELRFEPESGEISGMVSKGGRAGGGEASGGRGFLLKSFLAMGPAVNSSAHHTILHPMTPRHTPPPTQFHTASHHPAGECGG